MDAKTYLETHWIKKQIWTHLSAPHHQDRLRRCAHILEGRGGDRFIDVGCGLGHSTAIMKRFFPGQWAGLEFFGDVREPSLKLFPDIDFFTAADFNLRPICGRFDGVVCSEVIEHVEDDQGLVRGLLDITLQTLVVTTPNRKVHDPGHLRVYTQDALAELFAGENAHIYSIGKFFYVVVRR